MNSRPRSLNAEDEPIICEWQDHGDVIRGLMAVAMLLLLLLVIVCVLGAMWFYISGKLTAALFWLLFAVVTAHGAGMVRPGR